MSAAPVTTGEILELTREARGLASLGLMAELDDRVRFFDHKVEVLERLVQHGVIDVEARLSEGALAHARATRDQYVELMITGV